METKKAQTTESQDLPPSRARHQGKVVWFNPQKGFGFIRPDDTALNEGKELFVHFHYLVQRGFKSLRKDDVVEFCIGQNSKGAVAQEVKILKAAEETNEGA